MPNTVNDVIVLLCLKERIANLPDVDEEKRKKEGKK
jgi:hypothetical protein